MSLTVGTKDLQQALQAVLPHAYKSAAGDQHSLSRIRFTITGQNLLVLATDTRTSALAIVSMWGDDDVDESGVTWDLSPESVRKLLAVHKPMKVSGANGEFEPEQTVLISLEGEELHTSDISGLLPVGEQLVLPVLGAESQFPDVEGYLGEAVYAHEHVGADYDGQPLTSSFAAFDAAVKAYRKPMAVRLIGHARHRFLVTVGESFIGAVAVQHPTDRLFDDQHEVMDAWEAWVGRLPQRMHRTSDAPQSAVEEDDDGAVELANDHRRDRHLASVDGGA